MKKWVEWIGLYWCILEMLYEEKWFLMRTECERIAFELRVSQDLVEEVVFDSELFQYDGEKFWSKSALERISMMQEKSEKARQSAENRWWKNRDDANALRTQSECNAIKEKKRKENIINNTEEKTESDSTESDEWISFEKDFWEKYPKKINKKDAMRKFSALSKKDKEAAISWLIRYIKHWLKEKTQIKYIPGPDRWINGRKWEDNLDDASTHTYGKTLIEDEEKKRKQQEIQEKKKQETEVENLWKQYANLDPEEQSEIEFLAEERCNAINVPRGKIGFEQVMKWYVMKIFREKRWL